MARGNVAARKTPVVGLLSARSQPSVGPLPMVEPRQQQQFLSIGRNGHSKNAGLWADG